MYSEPVLSCEAALEYSFFLILFLHDSGIIRLYKPFGEVECYMALLVVDVIY